MKYDNYIGQNFEKIIRDSLAITSSVGKREKD